MILEKCFQGTLLDVLVNDLTNSSRAGAQGNRYSQEVK